MPLTARRHARFCSGRCRVAAHRAGIPFELRALDRWVSYSPKKVPLTVGGRAAASTVPSTWSSFAEVRQLERRGFVLNGDGIVCLDLDGCLTGGVPDAFARAVLDRCPPTYVEVSPSGRGLHIWGRGELVRGRRLPGVELYGSGRFITITDHRFAGSVSRLADLSEVIGWLLT